jgi:hypothetical protein
MIKGIVFESVMTRSFEASLPLGTPRILHGVLSEVQTHVRKLYHSHRIHAILNP